MRWVALRGGAIGAQLLGILAGIAVAAKTDLGYWALIVVYGLMHQQGP